MSEDTYQENEMLHTINLLKKILTLMIFTIIFISCAGEPEAVPEEINADTGSGQQIETADAVDLGLQIEDVPEGVLLSFKEIPADAEIVFINLYKDEIAPTQWADAFAVVLGPKLDELKVTKHLVFPFAEKDQPYTISLDIERNNGIDNAKEVMKFQTQNGNSVTNNVSLLLNDEQTGARLSAEPVFSLPVEFEARKYEYILLFFPGDGSSVSSGIYSGNELSCSFSPELLDHIRENSPEMRGTFPAYAAAVCNINYNGVSWMLKIAQTEDFQLEL